MKIGKDFSPANTATIATKDCERFLAELPRHSASCIFTSPPYNIGKSYENRLAIDEYVEQQAKTIAACVRILRDGGSICWQVGNLIHRGEVMPLDALLYPLFRRHESLILRNRIVWVYSHGQHAKKRFSGRHETILWFTKGEQHTFNLDDVRVPQKYPGKKAYRGPNKGKLSGNPLGKNPGDVWEIPNVGGGHVEKTEHPCQFPIALAEKMILATTNLGELVVDPYLGSGTTIAAAVNVGRRGAGCDVLASYTRIARKRTKAAIAGNLQYRARNKPIYQPAATDKLTQVPKSFKRAA